MGRGGRVDYGAHSVTWDADNRQIVIRPKSTRGTKQTIQFGLGDAVIQFNLNFLPDKIVMPITGESTGNGILPPVNFDVGEWHNRPVGIGSVTKSVTGYNGTLDISFLQSASFTSKAATNDVPVKKNGIGAMEISNIPRLNW